MNKLIVILTCGVLLIGYTFFIKGITGLSYNEKIESLNKQNVIQKKKIEELSQTMNERSVSKNRAFFEALFNYTDIDKRYEKVQNLTTEKGFAFAFPSRSDQKHTVSVKSELLSLENYSKIDGSGSNELFLNVVEVAVTANSVTTNQTLIIQTSLIKEKNKWLVDDVQVKGNG
ncbi:hypothetical protein SAMN04488137_4712 [Fictibacillus solisalsi]|uniref:Uncharacterized protein n=1 Tax=Fictibacillus solisalsi TaxID=459525 RepID=A0A1H0BZU8_9BACL|nr:hypothetical protein [Fictibacillus solisalsi]SDN51082.1 hypothetical protein SAMN04488137_4712 [Fictibacillus solisalsi]